MHEQTQTDDHITLTEAANIAPGRPSTNCIWRWCRRGVLSRNGERVRLQHVRMGGMIYTTAGWLEDFGKRLAEADAKYFDLYEAAAVAASNARQRRRAPRQPTDYEKQIRERRERVARELDAAGIR